MNKKVVVLLMAGIIAIAAIFVATAKDQGNDQEDADIQDVPPTISTGAPTYQYVAKFVCGLAQPNTESSKIISPGDYKTIINIHNPQSSNVSIKKKVVIASAEEPRKPIAPSQFMFYRDLQPDYAFRIDCPDIYQMTGAPFGTFIEGFVVLFPSPSRQIDVTALYTAGAPLTTSGGSIVAMDIETIKPKISVPATTTSYVDSPP